MFSLDHSRRLGAFVDRARDRAIHALSLGLALGLSLSMASAVPAPASAAPVSTGPVSAGPAAAGPAAAPASAAPASAAPVSAAPASAAPVSAGLASATPASAALVPSTPALPSAALVPSTPALPSATRADEPLAVPSPAASLRCTPPEPTGRWLGRDHEDQWARGLYPAHEHYPEGWLALTFDDGPHPERTPLVLELLAEHDLHATFFLTGFAIRSTTYHLVQQMVQEGHTLANHGWRHDIHMADKHEGQDDPEAYIEAELELTQIRVDLAMMARDAQDFAAMDQRVFGRLHRGRSRAYQLDAMPELRQRHRALLNERGYSGNDRPVTLRWARPPGGRPYLGRYSAKARGAFARVLERMDLTLVMWNGGSGDSDPRLSPRARMDPERIAKTVRKAAARGGIYVAHDRITARALRTLVETLAGSDAEVVSLARLQRAKHQARGWCTPTPAPVEPPAPVEQAEPAPRIARATP